MAPANINTLILLGDVFFAQGVIKEAEKNYQIDLNLNKDSKIKELLKNKIAKVKKKISK